MTCRPMPGVNVPGDDVLRQGRRTSPIGHVKSVRTGSVQPLLKPTRTSAHWLLNFTMHINITNYFPSIPQNDQVQPAYSVVENCYLSCGDLQCSEISLQGSYKGQYLWRALKTLLVSSRRHVPAYPILDPHSKHRYLMESRHTDTDQLFVRRRRRARQACENCRLVVS